MDSQEPRDPNVAKVTGEEVYHQAPHATPTPEPETIGDWLRQNSSMLLVLIALLVVVIWQFGFTGLLYGLGVAFGLSIVIFLHELGHFAVAKWCDVHVETFSIGFGPALPGCRFQKGETTYMIGCIPLGGYVKMLGEGAETDEEDTDPRSFQNKSVPQRMAIISAGVLMNVILGAACFIFVYMMRGERQLVGGIGTVEPGSPAWLKGVQSGDMIWRLDGLENPSFNAVRTKVPLSAAGEMDFVFGPPGAKPYQTTIEPRRTEDDLHPVIGFTPPYSTILKPQKLLPTGRQAPVYFNSAASRASVPFRCDDEIVGVTDPQDGQVKELPVNPRNPEGIGRDYFALRRRLQDLAGQPITLRVQRSQADGSSRLIDSEVPPAYHWTLGLRMKMGRIVAVRQMLPGQTNPIQYTNQEVNGKKVEGDIIYAVEVVEADGSKTRWVTDPSGQPAEKDLDPLRLPFELKQWAQRTPGKERTVRLTVKRTKNGDPNYKETFDLPWDDRFRYSTELSHNKQSPVSVPELGIAYHVQTTVEAVAPNSPAARATTAKGDPYPLKKGDVIREGRYYQTKNNGELGEPEKKGHELQAHQWAFFHHWLQADLLEAKQVKLKVERGEDTVEVVLTAEEDKTWPKVDRGLILLEDQWFKKANNVSEAISMGWQRTVNFIDMVYQMLRGLASRRLSVENLGGPVTIFTTGYGILGVDIYDFIFFLGAISVNLAVVNFLPIPVLDGGHFVFLVYEGVRGKPASKKVLYYTNLTGLMLIGLLMVFVLFLDFKRLFY